MGFWVVYFALSKTLESLGLRRGRLCSLQLILELFLNISYIWTKYCIWTFDIENSAKVWNVFWFFLLYVFLNEGGAKQGRLCCSMNPTDTALLHLSRQKATPRLQNTENILTRRKCHCICCSSADGSAHKSGIHGLDSATKALVPVVLLFSCGLRVVT